MTKGVDNRKQCPKCPARVKAKFFRQHLAGHQQSKQEAQ